MTYGRPMKWEKVTFDASGMPIHIEPVDEDPRKWVERGGTGTKDWLLGRQAEAPVFAPKRAMLRGAGSLNKAASSSGEGDVVVTPVDSALLDHMKSPLGGELKSPPSLGKENPQGRGMTLKKKRPVTPKKKQSLLGQNGRPGDRPNHICV